MITCWREDGLLQPETALASWRQWSTGLHSQPLILEQLGGGRSNDSFLLESNLGKLVLRLNGPDSLLPDTRRHIETETWQLASANSIAPPLLHVDQDHRFLVCRYIENSLPSKPPFDDVYIGLAFDLLKRCHQLEINMPEINYAKHIGKYWQRLEFSKQPSRPDLMDRRQPMQEILEELIISDPNTGLCHHDPVIGNFVGNTSRLYLIDWEYAARGLVIMDFAALAVEWALDDAMVIQYTGVSSASLGKATMLYRYTCDLWGELTASR